MQQHCALRLLPPARRPIPQPTRAEADLPTRAEADPQPARRQAGPPTRAEADLKSIDAVPLPVGFGWCSWLSRQSNTLKVPSSILGSNTLFFAKRGGKLKG
jgi:hypothetical protein